MEPKTLKDNQSEVLASKLEDLLPKIAEEEQLKVAEGLLRKLKRLKPNPGQVWAQLNLNEEEDKLFQILCKLVWGLSSSHRVYEVSNRGKAGKITSLGLTKMASCAIIEV